MGEGEAKRRQILAQTQALEAMVVDTPGGRIHVQWDHTASASPNAPGKRDVLGTWLLSILAGHKRYAHITGLRGDALSPQILGMDKGHQRRRAAPRIGPGRLRLW